MLLSWNLMGTPLLLLLPEQGIYMEMDKEEDAEGMDMDAEGVDVDPGVVDVDMDVKVVDKSEKIAMM